MFPGASANLRFVVKMQIIVVLIRELLKRSPDMFGKGKAIAFSNFIRS